jgi:hypothetical protein
MASQTNPVYIPNFRGMDARRSPIENQEYAIGTLAINQGRDIRGPLHSRRGLKRLVSANGNHFINRRCYSIGALPQGHQLHLLVRASGGLLVAVKGVTA